MPVRQVVGWSFLADQGTFSDISNLTVTLTRNRGNKTWTFSNPTDPLDVTGDVLTGDFFASRGYTGTYAQYQKVVFYPSGIDSIQDGDVYSVRISDGATTKTYTVAFFDLYKPDSVTVYDSSGTIVSPGQTLEVEVGSPNRTFYANPSFAQGTLPADEDLQDLASRTLSNYSVSWSSSNATAVPVEQSAVSMSVYQNATGEWLRVRSRLVASFAGVGTSDVTASLPTGASSSFKVKVRGYSISSAVISGVTDQAFDGARKTPVPVVTYGGKTLSRGTDYTLQYGENTQVGEGTVTVVGCGDYEGSKTVRFTITESASGEGGGSNASSGSGGGSNGSGGTTGGPSGSAGSSIGGTTGGGGETSGGNAFSGDDSGSRSGSGATPSPAVSGQVMHRLYNAWSGEHFYTSDDAEYAGLVELGWKDEGEGWKAPETSSTPVFRMYNPYAGEHHYTMDASERDSMVAAGWEYEDIGWYSDDAKTVPLYREYNPNEPANNHNYTTSKEEHDGLVAAGWHDEGYAWYGI